ncbi:copper amine oxidase N-terminal domain-containing protein [Candidatus Cryosericum septentrionale]|jgi:hypothetical protein|uniref:Copper amine oxidase-like N-terminal domain-containing protein n=1 Tax=Candidatus Cryosericum septentrionale TaxID=2290913 RepID=A0A398DNK3_9BACT|nr:copper amine oxidase N-terminal domain-containing protein [Candidatus Cryosericum septentrionale]RIE17246.1 hypothetical protein SMC1_02700 [Candidatus Cryosericum septentrionale]
MKKFLSIFVALAMVLSLFAGVGARSAKAAVTLTATASAATLTGGIDAGATAVSGKATVTAVTTAAPTTAVVTIDTAAKGTFTGAGAVSATTRTTATLATTTDANFKATAASSQLVTVSSTANIFVGDIIMTDAATAGTALVTGIIDATHMYVTIGAVPASGTITLIKLDTTTPGFTATTADTDFKAVAGSTLQTVALTSPTGNLHIGDQVTVTMADTTGAGVKATGTVTIGGTVTADNVVTATVAGTAYNYTAVTLDTPGSVATKLALLINDGATYDAASIGMEITITAATAGVDGNAITLTATPAAAAPVPATLSSIALVPATVTLAGAGTQTFTATATYSDDTTATVAATYALTSGVGSVTTPAGVYTAPAATVAAQTAVVTGTYTLGTVTKTATAAITILGIGVTLSSIAIAPATVTLAGADTQAFVATATYSDATTATVIATYTPTLGTFSGSTYTAPAATVAAQTDTILGTYVQGTVTKTAYATVTISGSVVTTLPVGTVTLATPTPVSATSVLLKWTYSAADAIFFKIYRNQTGASPISTDYVGSTLATSVVNASYTYTDTTTAASQPYWYWVQAWNSTGGGTFAASPIVFTPAAAVVVPVTTTTPTALTVTSAGNFTGGVDGVGVAAVDALGTVVSPGVVNVTTAGVGQFDAAPNVSVSVPLTLTATSTDADWATLGNQYITFIGADLPIVGDEVTVTAAGASGVGTVLMMSGSTGLIDVTIAKVGTLAGVVSVMRPTTVGFLTLNSTDPNWLTVGTAQTITFTGMVTPPPVGAQLEVSMVQLQAAVKAYGFLTLSGAVSGAPIIAGTVATATWQDTTGTSHTASYTVVSGDSLTKVTTGLTAAINAVVGGNVIATATGSSIKLVQTVAGAIGNGKTLTASTSVTATSLTIHTLGGLGQPAYVEEGKTIQLVAVDSTGAIVGATWTSSLPAIATINSDGLVMAMTDSGVTLVTATYGTYSGSFVVIDVAPQTITSLVVKLVPATLKVAGKQQFGAIAASTGYAALDYTTQAAWADTLPVAVISNVAPTQGLLTYSTAETGNVSASAAGLTTTAAVTIDAAGVVTVVTVPVAVKKVIVLTVGTDIVTVDGKATSVDAPPEIVNGRTFVPIRFIAETFGSTVTWLPETKGVTIVLGDTTIGLQIGNATAVINSNIIALDAAPYIKNSRTMVPLRVISESFGGDVVWDPALRTITITYLVPVAVTPAP